MFLQDNQIRLIKLIVRKGQDVTRYGSHYDYGAFNYQPFPSSSRANTLLVSLKDLIFREGAPLPFTQRSATLVLIYGPLLGSIVSAGSHGEQCGTELGLAAWRWTQGTVPRLWTHV